MGNEMSSDGAGGSASNGEFLEEGFNLDSPDADKVVNFGTAAPNCQPKHTLKEASEELEMGQEVALPPPDGAPLSPKHSRDDSNGGSSSRKRQHTTNNENTTKKLSYVQMIKLGYQELVNAIIRPPRAEYKMEMLGPPAFTFCQKRFTRTDFTLRTKRGYGLECSHFEVSFFL